ncbi:MAG: hypothetical protein AAGF91_02895 [Actinomycetota bacterium]
MSTIGELIRDHLAMPFPASVSKGDVYGRVDSVMIGADICGWAMRAPRLLIDERERLASARDDLRESLGYFPPEAQPYFALLVRIADEALS